ncbi:MAG TPA: hypothetical protein VLZ07_06000 [Syntrophales bacterium]|nr:hypothetical protein [Syntrophales bacterium]
MERPLTPLLFAIIAGIVVGHFFMSQTAGLRRDVNGAVTTRTDRSRISYDVFSEG